ncbi:MAG: Type 1 glutamine amidotransferase-like domain-containing protein [Candidatus Bathyarchaeia archaeon]
MATLYFLGGENIVKRDAKEINARAFQDVGGAPSVLVFQWARASFDRQFKRRKRLFDYFRSLGANTVDFAEYSDSSEEIAEKMEKSDLVYLTGGQVTALVERLRKKGVEKLLLSYSGVVVGRSAGAMALGRWCLVRNRYSRNIKTVRGLGLVDFSVKAHYRPSADASLTNLSMRGRVFALAQGSALIQRNGELSWVGKAVLFENGKILPLSPY